MKSIINFLGELSLNNNRDWFNLHKEAYRQSLGIFSNSVTEIIKGIQAFDKNLLELQAKDTIFRIYKDIRFSRDKTPYKTHFGAYMAKGGRNSPDSAYYFHIEPGGTFIAAGIYMPDADRLRAIRQEIMFKPDEYMKIVKDLVGKGYIQHDHEDKLKKAPRGFPEDFKYIEELKFKHYIFARNFTDDQLLSGDFIATVIREYRGLYPYVSFMNTAMDFMGNE
jgi:uncharacterized protein (TIGR02453 family)